MSEDWRAFWEQFLTGDHLQTSRGKILDIEDLYKAFALRFIEQMELAIKMGARND